MKKKEATYPIPIREWSEDDRPREKLLKYGEHTLTNAELLAIMIRTGAPGKPETRTVISFWQKMGEEISQWIQGRAHKPKTFYPMDGGYGSRNI